MDPAIILLNLLEDAQIPRIRKDLILILLTAAKATIAQHWKSELPPTLDQWVGKVWDYFTLEKFEVFSDRTVMMRLMLDPLDKWSPFLEKIEADKMISEKWALHNIEVTLL